MRILYVYHHCIPVSLQLIMPRSSDKLGSIQQPVVSVDFDLCDGGESKWENVELSKDELEQLTTSLEAANKVCNCILLLLYHGKL